MRIKLLFCFFIITISAGAQTSVYHPFPDSNAVWGVNVICYQWNCGKWANYRYGYGQDTIIGAYSYKRVIQSMINYGGSTCSCFPWSEPGGYLRQDTSAKKVFWIPEQNLSTEYLLYDFSLNIGDTITGYPQWCPLVVQSIDSILVGTSYRKKINFADPYDYIVEGIGGSHGLVNSLCFAMDYGAVLNCFSEYGNVVYNTPSPAYHALPCDSVVGDESYFPLENEFAIFPNPATGELRIQNGKLKTENIEICNMMGQLMLSQKLAGSSQLQIDIDISQWKNGIYFVRTKTEKGIVISKFVKQ